MTVSGPLPGPWASLVLVLAVYRLFRLVAWDDQPQLVAARSWITGAKVTRRGTHNAVQGLSADRVEVTVTHVRPTVAYFIGCPWCVGLWLGLAVYVGWVFEPRWTLYACAPLALNTVVGSMARYD